MPIKRIPIAEIRRAPIRHPQLPAALIARIRDLQLAFAEVFPKAVEEWIDEFKRDVEPESEVTWWETLLTFYRAYCEPKELTFQQQKAAFKILLMLGMGGDFQSLSAEFTVLPEGAQAEISAMLEPKAN